MQDMMQIDLEQMSSHELQELHKRIETAIRAAIREKNMRLSNHAHLQAAQTPADQTAAAKSAPQPSVDLAAERDAWLAARRRGPA